MEGSRHLAMLGKVWNEKMAGRSHQPSELKDRAEFTQRTAECDALKLVNDTHERPGRMKLSHVVEQRTAERPLCEAARG